MWGGGGVGLLKIVSSRQNMSVVLFLQASLTPLLVVGEGEFLALKVVFKKPVPNQGVFKRGPLLPILR